MKMKNVDVVLRTLNELGLNLSVQCQYSPKGDKINYILANDVVYSIGNLSHENIVELLTEIHDNGHACRFERPKRLTTVLRAWLEELERHDVIESMLKNTTFKTRKAWGQLTEDEENDELLDKVEDLSNGLEMRNPNKIMKDYLSSLQDDTDGLWIEPPVKAVVWYYSNYDLTHDNTFDELNTLKLSDLDMNKFYRINNSVTSKKVMQMILKGYCEFYGIKKEITEKDADRMTEILRKLEVGV